MGIHKTEKPIFLKELIWPAKMIHIATDTLRTFAAFPQDAAQATSDPAVKRRERPLMAVFEILKPSLKRAIHVHRNSGQTCAVTASGLGTNGIFELLQTLLAGPPCASLKVVSEEVKSLTRKGGIHNAGLLRMQDQPPFRNQLLHLVQGIVCLRFITTHNDKIIGISDHLKTRRPHRLINGMEVEVGQQGTDNGALGRTLLRRPPGQPPKAETNETPKPRTPFLGFYSQMKTVRTAFEKGTATFTGQDIEKLVTELKTFCTLLEEQARKQAAEAAQAAVNAAANAGSTTAASQKKTAKKKTAA